jgi:hypothetical protein
MDMNHFQTVPDFYINILPVPKKIYCNPPESYLIVRVFAIDQKSLISIITSGVFHAAFN